MDQRCYGAGPPVGRVVHVKQSDGRGGDTRTMALACGRLHCTCITEGRILSLAPSG